MAECRVFVKNLHFAVTQKAIADMLNHAGFMVSRIQIQRSGLRFQQSRYCYAFLTVPNEEVQAALVSLLDKKMHPALSDKALFAEPAVPRMRNWPQENSVAAEVILAPPQPEEAQPQPEAAMAAEQGLAGFVEPPPLEPEKEESIIEGPAEERPAAAKVAAEKEGMDDSSGCSSSSTKKPIIRAKTPEKQDLPETPASSKKDDDREKDTMPEKEEDSSDTSPAASKKEDPAKDNMPEKQDLSDTPPAASKEAETSPGKKGNPAKDDVLVNEDNSDTSPASKGCVAATGSDTEKSSGSGKAAGIKAVGGKVEKSPSPLSRPSRPPRKRKKEKARRTRPSRPQRKRKKKPSSSSTESSSSSKKA